MFTKATLLATLCASATAFAPAAFNARRSFAVYDATAAEAPAEAEPEPVAAAAPEPVAATPSYVASPALPFMEYPPNLAGYVGDVGFDPLRFSDFIPMDFLREAELKHGRICQLAIVGFAAVDLGLRIYPTPEAYEGLTSVTAHDALVEYGAMGQLFLWIGLLESLSSVAVVQMLNGSGRAPGDFGLDPIGFLAGKSADQVNDMKLKEITHCRLAMFAFSGMVTQAVLTQGPFPYV
jgi:light-harvesting complex I chlorophyll a/b binding protein 1